MDLHVTWLDIALRLGAATLAGSLIGYDRGSRGQIAGLRTTILMCLAAAGAMIEANLMLGVDGKTNSSFTMMDALRFPLGILSGIGFIGAGAIVRRKQLVTGVTTAATMWFITVDGLVIGAGYFGFGAAFTVLAFVVLFGLKKVEPSIRREHRANLFVRCAEIGPSIAELRGIVSQNGFQVATMSLASGETRDVDCRLIWMSRTGNETPPDFVAELAKRTGVLQVAWRPADSGEIAE